jgi:hypothetical protein
VLLLGETVGSFQRRSVQLVLAGVVAILAVAGLRGYREGYGTSMARWFVERDRNAARLDASLSSFQALPRPSRVLVVGLEDAMIPWQSEGFVRFEFGDRLYWTVALPRSISYRLNSKLVRFADATNLQPREFDFVATYQPDETLVSIRSTGDLKSLSDAEVLVPALSPALGESRARPQDYGPLLRASAIAIDWGLWSDAERLLEQARQKGAADSTYQRLVSEQRNGVAASSKPAEPSELTAQPAHIVQPDGSGLGETELFWKVPEGVACEIHVNDPGGSLFSSGSDKSGHARTGKWVTNGMEFFLQDVSGGKALTRENTLAHVKVEVSSK